MTQQGRRASVLYGASRGTRMTQPNFGDQWIEIFTAGTHTDDAGRTHQIDASFLESVAGNFNPAAHEPPAVIGHPHNNAPAYGWVDGVRVQEGALEVKFKEVDPNFEQLVRDGRFKKRSASFYVDPKTAPGGKAPALRHVGFLGAQPPAVKGLRDIQFVEGEATGIEGATEVDPNRLAKLRNYAGLKPVENK
jgi:hypothetical protein